MAWSDVSGRVVREASVVAAALLLVVLGLALTPATAEATTFTVTKVADTNDGTCNSDCSLREAIVAANASAATPHTINFGFFPGCGASPCTITATSPLPPITRSSTTLDGFSAQFSQVLLSGNNNAFLGDGVTIQGNNVTVRGFWIFGFNGNGITVTGNDAIITGNSVGDVTGTVPINATSGVNIQGAARTRIGGTTSAERNVVSGNTVGIAVLNATDTTIKGNYVGTHLNGQSAQPNSSRGILVSGSASTTVGGTTAGERNVISGNGDPGPIPPGHGIEIGASSSTLILGNYLGLKADGSPNLGNKGNGVHITANSTFIIVGGVNTSFANQIAYNGGAGIRCVGSGVSDLGCTGGNFLINFIYNNGGLGIDLGNAGVTTNDAQDADTGPNGLQNFPVLTSVGVGGGNTVVAGTFNSKPNRSYSLFFFTQATCDPSSFGEGLTFLMSSTVNTPASGTVDVNVTFAGTLAIGTRVTALAIDSTTLDTSEFSNCATAEATDFIVTPTSGLQTTENGGQATFTVRLTTLPSAQVHIVPSVSDATEASVGPSHLTFTQTNARTPQTVTVTGLPDGIVDGNIPFTVVLASATSSDPGYNGRNPTDVSATNLDNGVSCTTRPKVTVAVAPESDERLRVTLSATGANNKLTQIQGISTTNAALETAALPPQTGTFLIPLGSVSSYSFVVHRLASGQPGTVRFYVRDGCGDWPTFVGGGVNGFP